MTSPAKAFAFLICLVIPVLASGQKLSLEVQGKPASEVLYDFSGRYGLQISFNEKSLSQYKVNITGEFSSPEEAIRKVIENLPFELEKQGDVFIIIPQKKSPKKRTYSITGQVIEKGTREPLPYSHVIINNTGIATDIKGSFSYISSTDSVFQIKATHLGYFILDTLVMGNRNVQFSLSPNFIGLNEVIITHSVVERASLIGREPGVMKLNHQVANFLPGFGDNSVFNLLRLQPGILASGEQTNELIVWGCYEGQSKVIFDGFTLYGLKNFNDNISTFNPLMAKDIEVYKGGFDARYGERVGGIVNITGKNGNTEKTSFTVDINNITMNGMVEIPLFKTGSLIFALRHTYYELYNPGDVNDLFSRGRGNNAVENVDVNIIPDYRFGDMNLKYSARIRNTDLFYISLYSGNDRFSYSINEPFNHIIIKKNTSEKNRQSGGSVFYGKSWKNGYSTHFSLNYTVLNSTFTDNLEIEKVIQQKTEQRIDLYAFNSIRENSLRVDNRFPVHESHILEGGMIYMANRIELAEDTFDIPRVRFDEEAKRMTLYFQDNIKLLNIIDIKAGFRLTRANNLKKFYFEPRLSASVRLGESFKINGAWGLYDQWVTKSSVLDDMGNYRYIWTVCDNESIPVLKAYHYVLGTSYNHNDLTVSIEGYYRNVSGLTRYIRNTALNIEGIYEGIGRSYGVDLMIKKDYKGHSAWISYTVGKTEELFEYFKKDEYRRAPQDQRHEVKAAILVNLDPFYISADYVFGSGFPSAPAILAEQADDLTYSRLDASFIYKFLDRRLKGEVGLSVLNVMNTENIKYANFERVSTNADNSVNLYSEAIPITPALYLKLAM